LSGDAAAVDDELTACAVAGYGGDETDHGRNFVGLAEAGDRLAGDGVLAHGGGQRGVGRSEVYRADPDVVGARAAVLVILCRPLCSWRSRHQACVSPDAARTHHAQCTTSRGPAYPINIVCGFPGSNEGQTIKAPALVRWSPCSIGPAW
jgi:hypothetical protein